MIQPTPGTSSADDQRELPVQIEQVDEQRDQREAVARQAQHRLHQQHGAGLHFVDHRVRQRAGRLAREQGQLGFEQRPNSMRRKRCMPSLAMRASAYCEMNCAMPRTTNSRIDRDAGTSTAELPAREAAIEQRLEQRGHQRFGQRGDERGERGRSAHQRREPPNQVMSRASRRVRGARDSASGRAAWRRILRARLAVGPRRHIHVL